MCLCFDYVIVDIWMWKFCYWVCCLVKGSPPNDFNQHLPSLCLLFYRLFFRVNLFCIPSSTFICEGYKLFIMLLKKWKNFLKNTFSVKHNSHFAYIRSWVRHIQISFICGLYSVQVHLILWEIVFNH